MSTQPTTTKKLKPHIRWMIRRDLREVLEIENVAFEFPWEEFEFIRVLRERSCIGMVAERDEEVLGFMIYELRKTELVILNLAVAPKWQGLGVGRALIEKLRSKLSTQRRTVLEVLVRERNTRALLFFQHFGFKATRLVCEPWDEVSEDGIEMVWRVGQGRPA